MDKDAQKSMLDIVKGIQRLIRSVTADVQYFLAQAENGGNSSPWEFEPAEATLRRALSDVEALRVVLKCEFKKDNKAQKAAQKAVAVEPAKLN